MESTGYSCLSLMNLQFPRQIFEKYSDINLYENPPSETEFFHADRRRQRRVEANSLFPKSCERA